MWRTRKEKVEEILTKEPDAVSVQLCKKYLIKENEVSDTRALLKLFSDRCGKDKLKAVAETHGINQRKIKLELVASMCHRLQEIRTNQKKTGKIERQKLKEQREKARTSSHPRQTESCRN